MSMATRSSGGGSRLGVLLSIVTIVFSALLFFAALFFPVFQLGNRDAYSGLMVLFIGWMGPFAGGSVGWYANPFLFLAWVGMALGKFRPMALAAVMAMVVGLGLALTCFGVTELAVNEAGTTAQVTGFGPGLYLWLASFVVALLGSLAVAALSFFAQARS